MAAVPNEPPPVIGCSGPAGSLNSTGADAAAGPGSATGGSRPTCISSGSRSSLPVSGDPSPSAPVK